MARTQKGARPELAYKIVRWLYGLLFGLTVLSYILLAFLAVPATALLKRYNLSISDYRLLVLPIVILLVIIWFTSLYGSLRFKSYSQLIRKSSDGQALDTISAGLLLLSLSQPFSSVLHSLFGLAIKHNVTFQPRLTIIGNYVSLGLMALSFFIILRGSNSLKILSGSKKDVLGHGFWTPLFIVASTLYSYFLIIQPISTDTSKNVYFLPNWLLLVTVAIPYLYIWYFGLSAAYNVHHYQMNVRGKLYKSALNYLAAGLSAVIISSILTEILTTISSRLSNLHLNHLLLIIYLLLIVDGVGYVLIAIGAKKLRKLEEV